jgi:hypothetical protein
VLLMIGHYSRTCWEPEEIIDGKERDHLARVDVRLEPGSCALQVGNGQALRHAKILLVGMTAHTARSRPIARLLTILVSSMGTSRALSAQRNGKRKGSPTSQTTRANWVPDRPRLLAILSIT